VLDQLLLLLVVPLRISTFKDGGGYRERVSIVLNRRNLIEKLFRNLVLFANFFAIQQ